MVKIKNNLLPEICPKCSKQLVIKPLSRVIPEGGIPYSHFKLICLKNDCKYESVEYKIKDKYLIFDDDKNGELVEVILKKSRKKRKRLYIKLFGIK